MISAWPQIAKVFWYFISFPNICYCDKLLFREWMYYQVFCVKLWIWDEVREVLENMQEKKEEVWSRLLKPWFLFILPCSWRNFLSIFVTLFWMIPLHEGLLLGTIQASSASLYVPLSMSTPFPGSPPASFPLLSPASPPDDLISHLHLLKAHSSFMPYFQTQFFHKTFWTYAAHSHWLKLPFLVLRVERFLILLCGLILWPRHRHPVLSIFSALLALGVLMA